MVAVLYGRAVEQSVIDDLLAGASTGRSGVLVIRGDPGIGKTALLDYAARRADAAAGPDGVGMRVIRVCGVESEAELPFAGCICCSDRRWIIFRRYRRRNRTRWVRR